jgi:mRNA interferase HigB
MRVISWKPLADYGVKRSLAAQPLKRWFSEVMHADWKSPQDIKNQSASASFASSDRVVFNIKGGQHRLVVAVDYAHKAVYIKFIGSHAEYDKIDVATVEPE